MARSRPSVKRALLLSAFALFAATVVAQPQQQQPTTDANNAPAPTTAATDAKPTTDATTKAETTEAATKPTTDAKTTTNLPALTTEKQTTATTSPTTADDKPKLSTTSPPKNMPSLPTLPGSYSYPPPAVPDTRNAPFMRQSTLPQGTFFIIVGSILAAIGVAVLVWRAVVACLLHRSVKRAALAQHLANDKAGIPGAGAAGNTAPFYKYTDQNSAGSLGAINASAGRGVRRTTRGPVPSSTPSQTNLFFSPTAPGGAQAGNRSSTFLPSGFYAAGQGAPQQNSRQSIHNSISMSDLRPDSRGLARPESRGLGRPSESPGLVPRPDQRRNVSTSSVNLGRPQSQRAPSMFLDDLLDDTPGQFPPSHSQTWDPSRDRF
ncbi:CSI2 protein-like protein [Apiospora kogelbergensis]|uniref:CSI2 protein-like protein n=1 Tax=Apiospora kogelbergensis TaxID=1337665 RepID=A0AAW0QQR7_9PEZI